MLCGSVRVSTVSCSMHHRPTERQCKMQCSHHGAAAAGACKLWQTRHWHSCSKPARTPESLADHLQAADLRRCFTEPNRIIITRGETCSMPCSAGRCCRVPAMKTSCFHWHQQQILCWPYGPTKALQKVTERVSPTSFVCHGHQKGTIWDSHLTLTLQATRPQIQNTYSVHIDAETLSAVLCQQSTTTSPAGRAAYQNMQPGRLQQPAVL